MNKIVIVLIIAIGGLAAWLYWQQNQLATKEDQLDFLQQRTDLLDSERQRLADQLAEVRNRELDVLQSEARAEVMQKIVEIRELEFLDEVDFQVLAREDLPELISRKIDELFTDDELANLSETYAAIGLLPEGYDIKASYMELFTEQVAAFYDQHADQLFMFQGKRLDDAINRMILAHELVHALQDQHFALEELPLEDYTNDDRMLAATSLIEGDASIAMTLFLTEDMESDNILPSLLSGVFSQSMEALNEAPAYMRESLLFPYVQGQQFAMALYARGGMRAVTEAFERVPNSSRQILHPQEYFDNPEFVPMTVDWQQLPEGQSLIGTNVLGEFGIRVLLGQRMTTREAEAAARGWVGDGYRVSRSDGGRMVELRTYWEDEAEAQEFANALVTTTGQRFELSGSWKSEHQWSAATAQRQWEVTLAGDKVLMLEQPAKK